MNRPMHQALYRNGPLILGGLLGSIVLLICGIAIAMQIASTGDELLPLILSALGAFVLTSVTAMLAALRRHRWTVEGDAVQIEERPLIPLIGRRRLRNVAFGEIASLSHVQNTTDELLTIITRNDERFVLPPGLRAGKGLVNWPDQARLDAFSDSLRSAMAAAGYTPPPIVEGIGFWNRPAGLALLGITFVASVALAASVLWGMWEGATARHRGGEAAAIMVMLPIGVAWLLRRSWYRRRSVLRTLHRR